MVEKASSIPRHLGLILDGNRRWAQDQGLPHLEGHRKGYQNLKVIGEAALARGVEFVSAYVFSTENWSRSREEVDYLMGLLRWVATNEVADLDKKGIRVRFLGTETGLDAETLGLIRAAEAKTAGNTQGTIALCLNYGGQTEIAEACAALIRAGVAAEAVTPARIAEHLYAPDIPAVDLVIRTSGEQRLSNFMLWRVAYAELYFAADKHWPDFAEADLDAALADYADRDRRYGGK